ncbi:hypothetical protein L208DRAFT_1206012, partial [Tricholoma matsutake]
WGLAATFNAHHKLHINTDGFATCVEVRNKSGCKWWVIATPRSKNVLASISLFENFDNSFIDTENFKFEAILLTADMELHMWPGTIHVVFMPESAICLGNHFYTISTITDTFFSLIHSFVGSSIVTNMQHTKDSRMLLRQILVFIH